MDINSKEKAYYITEIDLPSYRAQTIHVLKMIDNLSQFFNNVEIINFYKSNEYKLKNIKKEFLLKSKKNFIVHSIFKKKTNINFIFRVLFGFFSAWHISEKSQLIITRSFYASFFLTIMKKKHFLEIHTSIFGFTKFLFIFLKFLKSKYIIKVIFITKSLQNYYQKKYSNSLVLADGAEIGDFDIPNKLNKKIKKILYIGSFYKGRGIELILEIAKLSPNYNFTLIGNKSEFDLSTTKITNVKIFDYIKYYSVPKIIKKFDLLLMPYNPNFVQINSDNIKSETSNFMSPLKMFEYLSSGVPFLSSKIKVLNEVLKNNHNCLLVDKYDAYEWAQKIIFIDNNYTLRNKIKKQALLTAQKYSWLNRVKKIVKIFDESKKQ